MIGTPIVLVSGNGVSVGKNDMLNVLIIPLTGSARVMFPASVLLGISMSPLNVAFHVIS
jgi:hypothetical protein